MTKHPDKVFDMDRGEAEQRFNDLKDIYETLINDDERWVYDHLGEEFYLRPNHLESARDRGTLAFYHLPEYAVMLLISYAFGASASRVGYRVYVIVSYHNAMHCATPPPPTANALTCCMWSTLWADWHSPRLVLGNHDYVR